MSSIPAWVIALITDLIKSGVATLPQILAIGRANGMTEEEAAYITSSYEAMIAERDRIANATEPIPPTGGGSI